MGGGLFARAVVLTALATVVGKGTAIAQPLPGEVLYYVTDLGDLPGGAECCYPFAVNERAQATGYSCRDYNRPEAFLWDPADGMIGLGDLPGGPFNSEGQAINELGHVAGYGRGELAIEAFLWTPEAGMLGLGDLPGGNYFSMAYGINDLDQVVGYSRSGAGGGNMAEAFVWDRASAMTGLGDLPGGSRVSVAFDINNATQVVGWSSSALRGVEAFLWDAEQGMRCLGTISGGDYADTAYAINDLGQIVGLAASGQAFLYDPEDGLIGLGKLKPNDFTDHAYGVNDLTQVVGLAIDHDGDGEAFVWDAEHGMRELDQLIAAGADPDQIGLFWASGINNAGQIVAKTNVTGDGWLLTPFVLGDMNCDDVVDRADLPALLLHVLDPNEYEQTYPDCPGRWAGDINQDATVDFADWVALLHHVGHAVPERPRRALTPQPLPPAP